MNVEISIIIPVYNSEKYLKKCVESVINQTYKNIEILLINDGSSDNSAEICEKFRIDPRVRVFHKENGGSSSARNVGIKNAIGTYLMFCDSDDFVCENWCEEMLNLIKKKPNCLCVSNMFKQKKDNYIDLVNTNFTSKKITYFELYELGISGYLTNKIYKKSIIIENKIYFNESRILGEDAEFNIKYFDFCKDIIYKAIPLYYYTNNPNSVMSHYYYNEFELNLELFWERLRHISNEELKSYCDNWLYRFIHMFNIVFDERNKMKFLNKMLFNQKMIKTKEFDFCLTNSSGEKESKVIIKILKTKNYFLYWCIQKIAYLKQRRRKKV